MGINWFNLGLTGFKFWRGNELGKKLVRRVAPKFAAKREKKREEKQAAKDAKRVAEGKLVLIQPKETAAMDFQSLTVQIVLAVVRHALTAGGLMTAVGDDGMAQIAGVIALLVGGAWSIARKAGRATTAKIE